MYTRNSTYCASSSFTTSYGNLAAVRKCDKQMCFFEKVLQRQKFQDPLLDELVTELRLVDDVYDELLSWENPTFFCDQPHTSQTSLIRCLRSCYWLSIWTSIVQGSHLGFSAISHCRQIFCLISRIVVTRILQCWSHPVGIKIISAYKLLSTNRQNLWMNWNFIYTLTLTWTARMTR